MSLNIINNNDIYPMLSIVVASRDDFDGSLCFSHSSTQSIVLTSYHVMILTALFVSVTLAQSIVLTSYHVMILTALFVSVTLAHSL